MNTLRKQLFSGTGLPVNHNRRIRLCHLPALLHHLLHCLTGMQNIIKRIPRCQSTFFLIGPSAVGDQLFLQVYNLLMQIVQFAQIFHDVERTQQLAVYNNRIGIGNYILMFSGKCRIFLTVIQRGTALLHNTRQHHITAIGHRVNILDLPAAHIFRHNRIHLGRGIVVVDQPLSAVTGYNTLRNLIQNRIHHLRAVLGICTAESDQPRARRKIIRLRHRVRADIFLKSDIDQMLFRRTVSVRSRSFLSLRSPSLICASCKPGSHFFCTQFSHTKRNTFIRQVFTVQLSGAVQKPVTGCIHSQDLIISRDHHRADAAR